MPTHHESAGMTVLVRIECGLNITGAWISRQWSDKIENFHAAATVHKEGAPHVAHFLHVVSKVLA